MAWVRAVLAALSVLGAAYVDAQAAVCNRTPRNTNAPRTPGNNNFTIKISGNPQKYVPGEVYTVSLQGWREQYSVKKFTGFLLLVEASQVPRHEYGPHSVGSFQLFGDALTTFSEDCPNAIKQTSFFPKSEVQVLWTAPPAHSGCVKFRATVKESKDIWYMDDGGLTKELCEEIQDSPEVQPPIISQCCACDEAKYEVTFEGLWSRHTHPKDFPNNEWLTHFSDIIGASHSSDYMVWEYNKVASEGLKQVAEWGSTRSLESELKRQSDHIRTIIKARGLWHPNVTGKTFAVFRVDKRHHLMSLVSMLGPSPDWIVGVSALELCQANCSWIPHKTLNLYPYDAGTDSGVTYESANVPTYPKGKIQRITSSYPNDRAAPFYDSSGKPMKPLARLTITRQRVYEKSCSESDILRIDEPVFEVSDEDADRPECAVSEWSSFSPCSATCGKGLRARTRTYRMPQKAQMMMCKRQLEEKEMCAADLVYCPDGGFLQEENFDHRICLVSEWSPWTPCSETCGSGIRMRNRRYLDRMGRKKCNEQLVEKEMCVADVPLCENEDTEIISDDCAVTQWTDFSPCSKTCGKGITLRTRSYLVPIVDHSHCNLRLRDERNCTGRRTVCFDPTEAEEVCLQDQDTGPCRGYYERWFYDSTIQKCRKFSYGGCRGNRNNFENHDDCSKMCEFTMKSRGRGTTPRPPPPSIPSDSHTIQGRVDCVMSPWSEWSPCDPPCGENSMKKRTRTILTRPQNGGRKCRRLSRVKKCRRKRCPGGGNHHHHHGLQILDQTREIPSTAPPFVPYQPEIDHASVFGYDPDADLVSPNLYNPPLGPVNLWSGDPHDGLPVSCVLGDWGPWSPCTVSCGPEAVQQRLRRVVVEPHNGGTACGDTTQRRYCNLPPCPIQSSAHFPWLERQRP